MTCFVVYSFHLSRYCGAYVRIVGSFSFENGECIAVWICTVRGHGVDSRMFPCVGLDDELSGGRFLSMVYWVFVVAHLPHSSLCVLNTESPPWPLSAAVPLVARARRRAVRRSGDGSLLSENVVEVIQSRNASCDFRGNSRVAQLHSATSLGPQKVDVYCRLCCVC